MTSPVVEPVEPNDLPELPPRRPMNAVWFFVPYTILLIAVALGVILNAERLGLKKHRAPEPAVAEATAEAATDAQLRARIADLEAQLAVARAAAPATGAMNDATAQALSERLTRLEEGQGRAVRAAAAAIAAGALADAAEESGPFSAELATLERLTPDSPALARLRPLAETGAPTRAALAAEFPSVAARAAAASRSTEGGSFLARAVGALNSIITVRRVDDLTGAEADAVLARAERHVADGDLEGALQELKGLPASGQKAVAPWTEKARHRVEIEERIAALRTDALRELAARTSGAAA